MAPFIVIVVCYGILVYSLEIQYYIYSWLSITIIFISLNSTSNNQQPHIKMMLNNFLCSIYSKRVKNVESIVFLIVFCLVFLFLLGGRNFTCCSLLVEINSLLVTRCKITRYSLQKLLFAKNHSLFFAQFPPYSLLKITCYSLQNSLATRCRSCSLQKSTCCSLQN